MLTVRTSTSIHQADLCRPNKIRQASLIRAINSQLTTNTTKKTEEDVKLIKGEENQHEEYPASRRWFQTSLISVATAVRLAVLLRVSPGSVRAPILALSPTPEK
jgi:hypothetical protein